MHGLAFDIAHLLAGGMVIVSFMLLYQDRVYALLNIFALHSLVLALAVGWQAHIQSAPHLYVTAVIALVFKAIVIPTALYRIVRRLGIHRTLEVVGGVGRDMLAGTGLVALALLVMLPVTATADPLAREDLAFALAVVCLLYTSRCVSETAVITSKPSARARSRRGWRRWSWRWP